MGRFPYLWFCGLPSRQEVIGSLVIGQGMVCCHAEVFAFLAKHSWQTRCACGDVVLATRDWSCSRVVSSEPGLSNNDL